MANDELMMWSFLVDCGRMGDLEGLFIASPDEVADCMGKTIYFDEPLGKHSEIELEISDEYIKRLLVEQSTVEDMRRVCGGNTISGFNPIEMCIEQNEDDFEDQLKCVLNRMKTISNNL